MGLKLLSCVPPIGAVVSHKLSLFLVKFLVNFSLMPIKYHETVPGPWSSLTLQWCSLLVDTTYIDCAFLGLICFFLDQKLPRSNTFATMRSNHNFCFWFPFILLFCSLMWSVVTLFNDYDCNVSSIAWFASIPKPMDKKLYKLLVTKFQVRSYNLS